MLSIKSIYRLSVRIVLAIGFILPILAGFTGSAAAAANTPGAVFTLTNAASGNEVLRYDRAADGSLAFQGAFSTGGSGSGSALGSQGSLVLSQNNQWLFVVNAGSNQVSDFAVGPNGLVLTDVVASGGDYPISLTQNGDLLYVLNAGRSGNITGFEIDNKGMLIALAGSTQPLSNGGIGAAPGPAQIAFTPDSNALVVTEKATNRIDIYPVKNGLAQAPVIHPAAGQTPFGFGFSRRDTLITSEAFGGQTGLSALSSYWVDGNDFGLVSPSVGTTQTAACWVAVTQDGKYAFTTDAGSGTVSSYQVAPDGSLVLSNPTAAVIGAASHPSDMALSIDSGYLYTLNNDINTIGIFRVGADGSLAHIGDQNISAGAMGLAAR